MATTQAHPQRLGKYQIVSILGRGGMGVVYKARDTVIDRDVAIKTILTNEHVDRLLAEARSAGRLHHPNVVSVFDFGEENGMSYIVLEYADGVDLAHIINEKQPLSLSERVDIILQVSRGLAYAHDCGVVHRDMKPSNVRLTTKGTAKILDFGLARYDDTALTKSGYISGTIAYMSPERMHGESGTSDDIFALGATAYEVLTYQRAFAGSSAPEVMMRIMTEAPAAPSTIAELPPQFDDVILRCLSREKENRFATAHDFATALEEAFEASSDFIKSGERSEAFRTTLTGAQGRRKSRNYSLVAQEAPTQIVEKLPSAATLTEMPHNEARTLVVPGSKKSRSRLVAAAIVATVTVLGGGAIVMMRQQHTAPLPAPAAHRVVESVSTTTEAKPNVVLAAPVTPDPLTTTHEEVVVVAPKKSIAKSKPAPQRRIVVAPPSTTTVAQPARITSTPVPPPVTPATAIAAAPTVSDPRSEIASFIRRVAAAYTSRDASFFRENHLRYSDAMGDAIRKSPSVRVDLNVESIDVVDATHARVTVQRTDEFDGGAPAAKQRLVFVLERQNGAWRIARFERG